MMTAFLNDTNVLSELMRTQPESIRRTRLENAAQKMFSEDFTEIEGLKLINPWETA